MEQNKKIDKSAKCLIASDLIYTITALFAEAFLVAYFLKITNENITQISIYMMIQYILVGIGNVIMGNFVKNNPNIRTKVLSAGIMIRALFILWIVILGEKLATDFIIIAIFNGISESLYWSTHELIFIDVTNNSNRKDYLSIKKILSTIVKIIAPIILGTSIELYSFTKIAVYVLVLSLIQVIISLQIEDKELTVRNNEEKYNLKKYIGEVRKDKYPKIHKYYRLSLCFGMVDSVMNTLVTIITIMTFKTSLNLGILTTIFSIFSMVSLYLYKKLYNKSSCKIMLSIYSLLILIGGGGLLINISKSTLIIYNFAYTVSICIIDAIYNMKKGDLVTECGIEKWKVEYVMIGSVFNNLSKVTGFTIMLLVGIVNNMLVFKIFLLLVALCVPLYSKLVVDLEK